MVYEGSVSICEKLTGAKPPDARLALGMKPRIRLQEAKYAYACACRSHPAIATRENYETM